MDNIEEKKNNIISALKTSLEIIKNGEIIFPSNTKDKINDLKIIFLKEINEVAELTENDKIGICHTKARAKIRSTIDIKRNKLLIDRIDILLNRAQKIHFDLNYAKQILKGFKGIETYFGG